MSPEGQGFQVLFFSGTAYAAGGNCCILGAQFTGRAGDTGTFNSTTTLGPYNDWQAWFQIGGTGEVLIDNVQIIDAATNAVVATADAEQQVVGPGPGLNIGNAELVTDTGLVLGGKMSARLRNGKGLGTNSTALSLAGNTTYIIEFQYRVLTPDSSYGSLGIGMFPVDIAFDPNLGIQMPPLLNNATPTGTFSSGGLTAGRSSYAMGIFSSNQSDVIIDNIVIYRQEAVQTTAPPAALARLESAPYPRLGSRMYLTSIAAAVGQGDSQYLFSVDQVENRLAFFDLMAATYVGAQTQYPDYIRRLRLLNPNMVIMPLSFNANQPATPRPPSGATVDLEYTFRQSLPEEWFLRDSKGNYVPDPDYPDFRKMNISSFAPVGGQTYYGALVDWVNTKLLSSGVWDGIFFDDLFARTNVHILNQGDPALFDVDYNRNGVQDETIALVSDLTYSSTVGMLQRTRQMIGDQYLIMGNAGRLPELSLAPYVNGYLFECPNLDWDGFFPAVSWRRTFEYYRQLEAAIRSPRVTIFQSCGAAEESQPGIPSVLPTVVDFQRERFGLATALLGDAYYIYDRHATVSPGNWYDEYSVDYASGAAVEDTKKKGYLGQPLSDARELTAPGVRAAEETFEAGSLPATFQMSATNPPGSSVLVSRAPGEVVKGSGSLVISNPDHSKIATTGVTWSPATQGAGAYYLEYDWRILETFDGNFAANAPGGRTVHWDVLKGTSGTVHFPFVLTNDRPFTILFALNGGGGKIAIDNIRIYRGGVGPFRRDFENGFVLVNPLEQPYTFSASEIAGSFHRTNVRRIKGTQATEVNNGQPVSAELTLGPMDAIILLADPLALRTPRITNVSNAASGQPGVVAGSFVSIYGLDFTLLPFDDWSNSIFNGQLPRQLDGISVTIGGKPAYVNAVTPGQINVQAPDVAPGPVEVVVTTPGGMSSAFTTTARMHGPAFFEWPASQPVATHSNYTWAVRNGTFPGTSTVSAKPGEVITLWGTGFGPATPAVAAGQIPPVQGSPVQSNVTVTLGGVSVPVLGAVLSAYPGTYQIAIQIPPSLADGDYPIVATVAGAQSPGAVTLSVQH